MSANIAQKGMIAHVNRYELWRLYCGNCAGYEGIYNRLDNLEG